MNTEFKFAGVRLSPVCRCIAAFVTLALVACEQGGDSGNVSSFDDGSAEMAFTPPVSILLTRAIDPNALVLTVEVDGESVPVERVDERWVAQVGLARGASVDVTVYWSELFGGSSLKLATLTKPVTVPPTVDSLDVVFRSTEFDTTSLAELDVDNDGRSNLAERQAETDPRDASDPGQPVVDVVLPVEVRLPQALGLADEAITEAIEVSAVVDGMVIALTRDGSVWRGSTTAPQQSEVFVSVNVFATTARALRLARFEQSIASGDGNLILVSAEDYDISDDFDGDGIVNVVELADGTDPRTSDLDPCDVSQFEPGCTIDTDGDGMPDWQEGETRDDDGDGTPDYLESRLTDSDADGFDDENDPGNLDPCVPSSTSEACLSTADTDNDGVLDRTDNCPAIANGDQADADEDGIGDVCDATPLPDADGDSISDDRDNCPTVSNTNQADADGDGIGDVCDGTPIPDVDGDSIADDVDNCPTISNVNQDDADRDGLGDVCDDTPLPDFDGDGVADEADNCPAASNADQADADGDGVGDACDPTPELDSDSDGIVNDDDNCPFDANVDQQDSDGDGIGDVCDDTPSPDLDNDGIADSADNCPSDANADQLDSDADGVGDVCDPTPLPETDTAGTDTGETDGVETDAGDTDAGGTDAGGTDAAGLEMTGA